jgi:hypothetical protein
MELPHFTLTSVAGDRVAYVDVWQRKNLLLVIVDESAAAARYVEALQARTDDLTMHETACVVTRDSDVIEGLRPPVVVIADRWGEVHFAFAPATVWELPSPDELIEWLRFVQMQCPECQGEAR